MFHSQEPISMVEVVDSSLHGSFGDGGPAQETRLAGSRLHMVGLNLVLD
jgi:hypothetical protein